MNPLFMFDANYVGPALVSAASFLSVPGTQRYPLTLVFLAREGANNDNARVALASFEANAKQRFPGVDLRIIELTATIFEDYVQRYHFSSAIMYKLVLPQVFPTYDHIMLFDCGMLFGHGVVDFLDDIGQRIERADIAPVAALCFDPEAPGMLDESLRRYPHHRLYPAATFLYFDVQRFTAAGLYERFVNGFHTLKHELMYAEQDLMCLVLQEQELSAFPERDDRIHIDMADPQSWHRMPEYEARWAAKDFFYMKHFGSFKPWKKWVLNPVKAIYLRELEALRPLVGDAVLASLHDDAAYPDDIRFLQQQLQLLEHYYETTVPLR